MGARSAARCSSRVKTADVSTIGKAIDNGIAYVTEDRKTFGLNLIDHIKHNTTIVNLDGVSHNGVLDDMAELKVANEYRRKTNIRSSSIYQKTGQSFRWQPAEGCPVEMAVRQSGSADS